MQIVNDLPKLDSGTFASGQLYVALSRAKPIAMRDVKADPAVLEFYRLMGI